MGRRKKGDHISGWVIVDKPVGPGSTNVVAMVRRIFNAQKAGHAGTLDPLASGILPVALGEATKTVPFIIDATKGYRFTVSFGTSTTTDDLEGSVVATSDHRPGADEIVEGLKSFTGEIMQVPPAFSAIKVDGERAYDLARAGEVVELKARPVTIHNAKLLELGPEGAVIEISCSKGTYVRSLARDLALLLGTVGHVSALRRIAHGPFREADAIALDKLMDFGHIPPASDALWTHLKPLETALDDIPVLALSEDDASRLKQGQAVLLRGRDAPIFSGQVLATHKGNPVALTEYLAGELRPVRVFNLD
ncbi:MAG: tRNA pseudouridine(55) synthase TruB [Parvibaculum sp.]|nr:tRNA pseudouridine(55) synthase TruB [Parvibaculum sp.]